MHPFLYNHSSFSASVPLALHSKDALLSSDKCAILKTSTFQHFKIQQKPQINDN